jgi:hypothetical protein
MATIHLFVADIVDRIPAMAKDGPDNNRMLLENLTREFLNSIYCSPMVNIPEEELPTVEDIQKIYEQTKP